MSNAEKTVNDVQQNEEFASYCIPATFVDQKFTDAMNAKYPDKPRVVIHTRNADRSINWEESLMFTANKKNGKPRFSPMTDEQKEKQGLDKDKAYYIVNFSQNHKDKLFINKRVGTDENGKGIYEKTTKELSAAEFAATMKNLEPWHRYKQQESAGKEQTVEKKAEKAPKAQEAKQEVAKAAEKEAEKAPKAKKTTKKATKTAEKTKTNTRTQ